MSLDKGTKEKVSYNFAEVRSQLMRTYPNTTDADYQGGKEDPDQIVSAISDKTGESKSNVEAKIKELV